MITFKKMKKLNFISKTTTQFYLLMLFAVHNTIEGNVWKTTSRRLLFKLKNRKILVDSVTSRVYR